LRGISQRSKVSLERTGKKCHPVPFGDGKGAIYGMAAGDLNGDEWPDVVVARSEAPCFVMFNRPPKK
jgi:hypothetical protein